MLTRRLIETVLCSDVRGLKNNEPDGYCTNFPVLPCPLLAQSGHPNRRPLATSNCAAARVWYPRSATAPEAAQAGGATRNATITITDYVCSNRLLCRTRGGHARSRCTVVDWLAFS